MLAIEEPKSQTTNRIVPVEDGSVVTVSWQKFAAGIGPFVSIRTGMYPSSLSHDTIAQKAGVVCIVGTSRPEAVW